MTARLAVEAALLSADSRSLGVVGTGAAASLSLVVGGCDGREVMPRSLNEGRPLLYEIWSDAPPCARPFFLEVCGLSLIRLDTAFQIQCSSENLRAVHIYDDVDRWPLAPLANPAFLAFLRSSRRASGGVEGRG